MDKLVANPVKRFGKQYWDVNGQIYMKVGTKLIRVDGFEADGTPICKSTWSETKKNAQGGQNCTVHVECFEIGAAQHKPG